MFVAIVPAYNEEKTIFQVVQNLKKYVDEIIVVDDFSKDNTAEVAKKAGAVVVCHILNRGQGASLQTGHECAKMMSADYVLHFDADDQFYTEDIIPALAKIKEEGIDVLFGSRYLNKKSDIPWFKKNVIHPLGRFVNKIFFKIKLSDAHLGFRILNKKAVESLEIKMDRMAHASEIPALVMKNKLKFAEIPVGVKYAEYGQKFSGGFKIIRDLIISNFIK